MILRSKEVDRWRHRCARRMDPEPVTGPEAAAPPAKKPRVWLGGHSPAPRGEGALSRPPVGSRLVV